MGEPIDREADWCVERRLTRQGQDTSHQLSIDCRRLADAWNTGPELTAGHQPDDF